MIIWSVIDNGHDYSDYIGKVMKMTNVRRSVITSGSSSSAQYAPSLNMFGESFVSFAPHWQLIKWLVIRHTVSTLTCRSPQYANRPLFIFLRGLFTLIHSLSNFFFVHVVVIVIAWFLVSSFIRWIGGSFSVFGVHTLIPLIIISFAETFHRIFH